MGFLSSCACVDWLVLVLSLLVVGRVYCTWTYGYWKKRGVPFVQPTPGLGNMKDSMTASKSLGEVYQDIYKALKGCKYGGFYKFRQPALLIRDPGLIKDVLIKDFSSFHDNDFHVSIDNDPLLGRNPFALQGERWRAVRSQLTPAFTTAKVRPLFPLINEVCADLRKYLETHKPGPDGLEAKEVAAKFTSDVVATCAFGLHGNSFTDPNAQFREMGRRILQPSTWKNIQHTCIFLAPALASALGFKFFDETVEKFFRQSVTEAMSYRDCNKVTRNDFLQLLMQLKAKGQIDGDNTYTPTHEKFTDDDIVAHAATFFNDGFETSSTTLAFTLYELALNPEILSRLRTEVDSALEDNDGQLNYDALQMMPYLDMVLSESMRKYPAVTFLNRLCTKPYELPTPGGGTVRVEVGTPCVVPIWALHHDAQHYPDPERFDPERFTEENRASRPKCVYLPFGEGPRICLGIRFALTQTKAGLASIVANFDIQMSGRTAIPVVPDPQSFLLAAKGGIWLKFSIRN